MLTNGKNPQICKHVFNDIYEIKIHLQEEFSCSLPAVLREGNRKSPRTAAHICKSISEIPGISEMLNICQKSKEGQKNL